MIFAYTVCTLNYLPHARALYESFHRHHPDIPFFLGLVDRTEGRVDGSELPFEVIEVEKIAAPGFSDMVARYNILELTCALKAFFGGYFFDRHPELTELWYFDTDIQVYNPLTVVSESLAQGDILITPHFFTPYTDRMHQSERNFLNSGLYNAGFFALKRSADTGRFLAWWQEKVSREGYVRFDLGMFLDQLWLNFVPLFFRKTVIAQDLGLNVGYWNLHERKISIRDNNFWVNGTSKLCFYHFSGFDMKLPQEISIHQNRWNFENRPDVKPLYEAYAAAVEKYDYGYVSGLRSVYDKKRQVRGIAKITDLAKRRASFVLWKLIKIVEPNPEI